MIQPSLAIAMVSFCLSQNKPCTLSNYRRYGMYVHRQPHPLHTRKYFNSCTRFCTSCLHWQGSLRNGSFQVWFIMFILNSSYEIGERQCYVKVCVLIMYYLAVHFIYSKKKLLHSKVYIWIWNRKGLSYTLNGNSAWLA